MPPRISSGMRNAMKSRLPHLLLRRGSTYATDGPRSGGGSFFLRFAIFTPVSRIVSPSRDQRRVPRHILLANQLKACCFNELLHLIIPWNRGHEPDASHRGI